MATINTDPAVISLPADQPGGSGKQQDDPKSPSDAQNKPKVAQGMKPETMTLFEGPPKCSCCINWVEEYPDDIKENIEGAEGTRQYALLVRKRKSHNKDNPDPLELDSIVIRSPLIKKVLEGVFGGYPGITVKLEHLSFKAPFAPFLHRWTTLEKATQSEVHDETQKHMKLLYNALGDDVMKNLKSSEDLLSQGVMTFELLWTLFKPGDLVYRPKEKLLYELIQADMQGPEFVLFSRNICWDGMKLGYSAENLKMSQFEGTKAITDLAVYPIEYYPSPEQLKQSLKRRGEKFSSLRGIHHKSYQGVGIQHKELYGLYNLDNSRNFSERIVIDAKTFYDKYPNKKPSLDLLDADLNAKRHIPTGLHDFYDENAESLEEIQNLHYSSSLMDAKSNQTKIDEDFKFVERKLTDRQLMIATKWVVGYGLKSKEWVSWDVEIIQEIQWNDQAIQNLALPPAHKELILGFVESQMDSSNNFDDFIENKGRGLVFLLSGPPGVGKTFTVEATAEELQAPIYSFSAVELGFDSTYVESNFGKMLDTASKWGAVLLLDEADVFLEQRTVHDLERNRLVSVFLRMLEYFNGVLFLTTNRPSQIDEAFQSRIDVHIDYPNLDANSRRMIWKNFFSKSTKPIDISDDELSQLAQISLNGRQIKSLVKQAQLIAMKNRSVINIDDINRVLSMFKTSKVKEDAQAS